MNLITIGKIATQVMNEHPEFVKNNPDVPWRRMRGMRNRTAHGYFDIKLEIVRATVRTSLPELERLLNQSPFL